MKGKLTILSFLLLISCRPNVGSKKKITPPLVDRFSNVLPIKGNGMLSVIQHTRRVVTCSAFTYSAYGACQSNNTQSRSLLSSSPPSCTGGNPVTSQGCTYKPPLMTINDNSLVLGPKSYQVYQRYSLARGKLKISVRITKKIAIDKILVTIKKNQGILASISENINLKAGDLYEKFIDLPAGAWYSSEIIQMNSKTNENIRSFVDNSGIGDVFITAGQSNSVNTGQTRTKPGSGLFVAFDPRKNSWGIGNDPQPGYENGDGGGSTGFDGSTWPAMGDTVAAASNIPVAVVLAGFGGSGISQWQKNHQSGHYERLKTIIHQVVAKTGGIRMILWHQGESDAGVVNSSTTTADYQNRFIQMKADLISDLGGGVIPWMMAVTSFVPANYHQNDGLPCSKERLYFASAESIIRAQLTLIQQGYAMHGPITDDLNRYNGPFGSCIHFSTDGSILAGQSWGAQINGAPFAPFLSSPIDLLKNDLFNASWYIQHYPDILANFGNNEFKATQHWLASGHAEGRQGVSSSTSAVNICSSFTYSAYGACQVNNTQSRSVVSSSPINCIGGNPIINQGCSYPVPLIIKPLVHANPNLIVGTFYFPGWNKDEAAGANGLGEPHGWKNIMGYPERQPLEGWYYDGELGESGITNSKKQIKYAVESGINLFIYNWFRLNTPNSPRTVTPALGSALHNGFMKANTPATGMKFAIHYAIEDFSIIPETRMNFVTPYANVGTPGGVLEATYQLANVLYPFWSENYFKRTDYQRVGGRPLLFFLSFDTLLHNFGLPADVSNLTYPEVLAERSKAAMNLKKAIDAMKYNAILAGDKAPLLGCSINGFLGPDNPGHAEIFRQHLTLLKAAGCDFRYEYGNSSTLMTKEISLEMFQNFTKTRPSDPALQSVNNYFISKSPFFNQALGGYAQLRNWEFTQDMNSILPSLATLSSGWSTEPWGPSINDFYYSLALRPLNQNAPTEPTSFYGLLSQFNWKIKTGATTFSRLEDKNILLLGSWNEYGEGHYIEPSKKFGTEYLDILRFLLK